MKLKDWLAKWDVNSLHITTPFLEAEWAPTQADQEAAWQLYIELLTRRIMKYLPNQDEEIIILSEISVLIEITRDLIKKYGREAVSFSKLAIVILNQTLLPFISNWRYIIQVGKIKEIENYNKFNIELKSLQDELKKYIKMLADFSGVEDLSELE